MWQFTGTGCSGAGCGTLTNMTSSSVTYTAPVGISATLPVSLEAVALADKDATATVTIDIVIAPTFRHNSPTERCERRSLLVCGSCDWRSSAIDTHDRFRKPSRRSHDQPIRHDQRQTHRFKHDEYVHGARSPTAGILRSKFFRPNIRSTLVRRRPFQSLRAGRSWARQSTQPMRPPSSPPAECLLSRGQKLPAISLRG